MAPSLTHIGGPADVHNARTPDLYRAMQATYVKKFNQVRPQAPITVHAAAAPPRLGPLVEQGFWKIACAECGNWPSVEPVWGLACCLECGAVYEGLVVNGDLAAIEADLLTRPLMADRNWP